MARNGGVAEIARRASRTEPADARAEPGQQGLERRSVPCGVGLGQGVRIGELELGEHGDGDPLLGRARAGSTGVGQRRQVIDEGARLEDAPSVGWSRR